MLHNLTFQHLARFIDFYRKKLHISIQNLCRQSHVSTASYYKMRRKEVKAQCYLRLLAGFMMAATEEEVQEGLQHLLPMFMIEEK